MDYQTIDGALLRDMLLAGATQLEKHKREIDALNVFPVPDGDTGTNMSLTMTAAMREIQRVTEPTASTIANALSMGALRGARGNSGVILSQLFRGFSKSLGDTETIDAMTFAAALKSGVEMAYKTVMKPKEGTVLTVARVASDAVMKEAQRGEKSIGALMNVLLHVGKETLLKTPDMLPVLKQAGVVDAGGQGLLIIYSGFREVLDDAFVLDDSWLEFNVPNESVIMDDSELGEITFGYCTEFLIKNIHDYVDEQITGHLQEKLLSIGDSLVFVVDDELIKVHVHTNMPGKVLQWALALGSLSSIKIDNMREQHRPSSMEQDVLQQAPAAEPAKEMGMVAVAMGEGLSAIFKDLTVDGIIEGGQTMNPSIEDIAKTVNQVPAQKVFFFPNNSNIILAGQQASQLCDKTLCVIPTKSVPQGIAAALAFNPEMPFDQNEKRMLDAIAGVKTGQVTYAVRDSTYSGGAIRQGDIIGLAENEITQSGDNIHAVSLALIQKIVDTDEDEIITIFYGADVSREDAEALAGEAEALYPDCDVEIYEGNQPLYYYLFSVD